MVAALMVTHLTESEVLFQEHRCEEEGRHRECHRAKDLDDRMVQGLDDHLFSGTLAGLALLLAHQAHLRPTELAHGLQRGGPRAD